MDKIPDPFGTTSFQHCPSLLKFKVTFTGESLAQTPFQNDPNPWHSIGKSLLRILKNLCLFPFYARAFSGFSSVPGFPTYLIFDPINSIGRTMLVVILWNECNLYGRKRVVKNLQTRLAYAWAYVDKWCVGIWRGWAILKQHVFAPIHMEWPVAILPYLPSVHNIMYYVEWVNDDGIVSHT